MYHYALLNNGYTNIHKFENTVDCLDHLDLRPGIIFLNYLFSNKNGVEILKQIKRINPDILLLFISEQNNIKIAVDAIRAGAFEYIGNDDLYIEYIEKVIKKTEPILISASYTAYNKFHPVNQSCSQRFSRIE